MAKSGSSPNDRKKVLITGASGNLGTKLRSWLEAGGRYELVLMDIDAKADPQIIKADLSDLDESWPRHFHGVDSVVHLAASIRSNTPWEDLQKHNLDSLLNVIETSVRARVRRFVFASSNTVMDGYRNSGMKISSDMPPRPMNGYAASKLAGERICRSFSIHHGLSTICLRIGTILPGDNSVERLTSEWEQKRWISDRDFCLAVEKSITVEELRHAVLNVMSDNVGAPWDLDETRLAIDYEPRDRHIPRPQPAGHVLRGGVNRVLRALRRRDREY